MKKQLGTWGWIAVALALLIFFASIFIQYAQPMKNDQYNLSLVIEPDEVSSFDRTAELGWTIFTQEGDTVTPLTFDGLGCFEGLQHLGQTFYYSRVMQEQLASPTLTLSPINRNFSVFLDGVLLYTDCPKQDNRIGHLTLPSRDWERPEDLVISLPEDYVGKTLTIAQSTPNYAETPRMATRVIPSPVTLYCSYAYESQLIAESFQTAYVSAAAYSVGLLLLGFFLYSVLNKEKDMGLLLLALAIFMAMAAQMHDTSYQMKYFAVPYGISVNLLCQWLATNTLLFFLALKARRTRIAAWITAIVSLTLTLSRILMLLFNQPANDALAIILSRLESLSGLPILVLFIIYSLIERKHDHPFHRWFAPLSIAGILLWFIMRLTAPDRSSFLAQLHSSAVNFFDQPLACILLLVSLFITLEQLIRHAMNAHAEKQLMKELTTLSQQRYESLRVHNEEVMMLRHDMKRHFQLLRQTTTDEKTAAYLDELLDKNEKIRPVIQSGNTMLDTILCGRLNTAMDQGIKVEIVRADAPQTLPVSNTDLCSLVMNLIDNAINAARDAEQPLIKLDLHEKSGFFVFVCENTMNGTATVHATEKTVPKHGLGLKIVHQIAERYGHLLTMEATDSTYKVSLAIPLPQPAR